MLDTSPQAATTTPRRPRHENGIAGLAGSTDVRELAREPEAEAIEAGGAAARSVPAPQPVAFTLVIPAHNEEDRLPDTLREYAAAATGRYGESVEIIVVANGSADRTAAVADSMRTEIPQIRVIDIAESIGKGGAVLEGLKRAAGARVAFADADCATDSESLFRVVDGLDEADVVIGSRRIAGSRIARKQPLRRRILSRIFNRAVRVLFGLPYRDTQCGAKAFRAQPARRLAEVVCERWWAFDLDLLLSARRLGYSIVERPVTWSDGDGSRLKVGQTSFEVLRSLAGLWLQEHAPWIRTPWTAGLRRSRQRRILALNWRFIRHPEAGGAELNLFEQARRWRRDGNLVTVVCARRGNGVELPADEEIDGIEVRRMGGKFTLYLAVARFLMWHGHEYDEILDVANGIPFFTPLFTATPSVLFVHHVSGRQWFAEFPRPIAALGAALERYVVPRVYRRRRAIAVSPTTRDAMVETGFKPEQVEIVYNGTPDLSAACGDGSDEPAAHWTLAYVGRLKRYKQIDRLILAFAGLRNEFPDLRLEIAGEGDAADDLRALVTSLGIDEFVTFHGFVDDETKLRILDHATVFATPSMQEGWGLSVLEANARGCPAVAFDVPGLRSAIVDGETGLLAADEREFRDDIARLLLDPELRARMSEAARRWAARFDWETAASRTLTILGSASAESGAQREATAA